MSGYHSRQYQNDVLRVVQSLGTPDPSHFIFEINVGQSRIRHTTTGKQNDRIFRSTQNRQNMIQIQSRSMSDPTLSDNNLKKWLWSGLPLNYRTWPSSVRRRSMNVLTVHEHKLVLYFSMVLLDSVQMTRCIMTSRLYCILTCQQLTF